MKTRIKLGKFFLSIFQDKEPNIRWPMKGNNSKSQGVIKMPKASEVMRRISVEYEAFDRVLLRDLDDSVQKIMIPGKKSTLNFETPSWAFTLTMVRGLKLVNLSRQETKRCPQKL
jgi:hypothetical protein